MSRFWDAASGYVSPRNDDSTVEYAAKNVQLFPPITRAGFFHVEGSRHFLDIFSSLDDGRVREVNILKPVRGGGSLIGDVHLCTVLPSDRHPGPYMNVFQTDQDAKMHFFDRIERLMAGNENTRALLPGKYEWSEIRLLNGHTLYTGGPSISNLQSKGVRYLRLDECWIYPPGRMAEAEARVGDYLKEEMSKIIRISQAGPRAGVELAMCEWNRAYNRGQVHEWEVACLHCGKYYEPVFSGTNPDGGFWGITWDKFNLPNGDWDLAKCVSTVRFECPHCHQPAIDNPRTKAEWNRTGRYRAIGEENKKRKSYHWESVIDFPWDELVELWLDACNAERRGDLSAKLQFYQKRRAMFKDEESLLKGGLSLSRAIYEIESDWADEKVRFMTIDRQEEDVFWWTVRAWSDQKSRRLGFGKAFGFSELEEIRKRFKVLPHRTMCDSGFSPKGDNGVYSACVRFGWIALKGDKAWSFVHRLKNGKAVHKSYAPLTKGDPASGTVGQGRRYANLLIFSKNQMNGIVQRLIDSGAWEEPAGGDPDLEKEYNVQMAGRIRKTAFDKTTGETRVFWYESKNDHARDLANMQALGAVVIGIVPDPSLERLTESEQKDATTSTTQ